MYKLTKRKREEILKSKQELEEKIKRGKRTAARLRKDKDDRLSQTIADTLEVVIQYAQSQVRQTNEWLLPPKKKK